MTTLAGSRGGNVGQVFGHHRAPEEYVSLFPRAALRGMDRLAVRELDFIQAVTVEINLDLAASLVEGDGDFVGVDGDHDTGKAVLDLKLPVFLFQDHAVTLENLPFRD